MSGGAGRQRAPIELFFSYSYADRALRDELERHLAVLKREGVIDSWHDRQIGAGREWASEIDAHLDSADIILLLVSADFLSSDYCYDVEMRRAMARHDAGDALVIPVLLRAVEWRSATFSRLQAVPTGGLAITSWSNQDEAFADVTREITRAAQALADRRQLHDAAARSEDALERPQPLGHQQELIEERAHGVVGRAEVEGALDRFVAKHRRGYFLVEGGPGEGKTAFAANLVVKRGLIHHFFGRGARHSPDSVLRALIRQLETGTDPPLWTSASLDSLSDRFEAALRRRAQTSPPVILLFDGLNELATPEGALPSFLPAETLPDGVYVVVTSQPGDRLEWLKEETAMLPSLVHRLGPLRSQEIRALVIVHQPGASESLIERLADASGGNALYLRAALDSLGAAAHVDLNALPEAVEGYYRRATRRHVEDRITRDILGLLAASRQHLSVSELSEITGASERAIHASALTPLRPFLVEVDRRFGFYHERFHDFVVRELLFQDELRDAHARIAEWLTSRSRVESDDYYWTSLTYHLHRSAQTARVIEHVGAAFLASKLQRFGYGVLEDLELLVNSLLATGHADAVAHSVAALDELRRRVGDVKVDELARSIEWNRRRRTPAGAGITPRRLADAANIDAYAVLLPKRDVTADFVQAVPRRGGLVVAIGDAPKTGLNSAFVARFVALLFRWFVQSPGAPHVGRILDDVNAAISSHAYFERISMLCVEIAPGEGLLTLASAGHPQPVLYAARGGSCDRLPVGGWLLHSGQPGNPSTRPYQIRHAEIGPGDVIVLTSDGVIDGGVDDPYGYRFMEVIVDNARHSAKRLCTSIVDDWQRHLGGAAPSDDATIIAIKVTSNAPGGVP